MKQIMWALLFSVVSVPVVADDCTSRIDSYLAGLDVARGHNPSVEPEIQRIESLRVHSSDCQVLEAIPALKRNKDTLEQMKALGY